MDTMVSLRKFFTSLLKPYKWWILGILITGIYWGINNSLSPYVLKLIIDKIVAFQGDKAHVVAVITPLVFLYLGLWILICADMRYLDYIRLKLFPSVNRDIVCKMFGYLNRHSHTYFQNNFTGGLANKISDMTSGFNSIFLILEEGLIQFIGLLIAMGMLIMVSPIFAYILLGWAAVYIAITLYFLKPVQYFAYAYAVSKTTMIGKIVDSISNISNIRLFAGNQHENELIRDATNDMVHKDQTMEWFILKMRILWDCSVIILIALDLFVLIHLYSKGRVTVGDFSFIISLSITMFSNLWYLASQFVDFAQQIGKCQQAMTILAQPHTIVDRDNAETLEITAGRIEFDNVSFHYDKGTHLFKNKSIIVEPGQKVGLVGLSGSGKSTFVNLILRIYDVESGVIRIDGKDIREISQDSLRDNIMMIAQDITLFHRTLMDNIRYGRFDATDEEVIEASKKAHCHEFVLKMPEGYQTMVGERGVKLSGGQRQRIAIARAILKNAPILILDEATSALDSVTEKYIQDSLHSLMEHKTTIVIAHRLSTLSEMDRILVFEHGHIIEDGTHDELIRSNGAYAKMWRLQAGGFLVDDDATPETE